MNPKKETFITITGADRFMGIEALRPNQTLKLVKDIDNNYDDESIKVIGESGATYGYVANSVYSVARGSHSAGYIYETFEKEVDCKVLFITNDIAIAQIL